MSRAVGRVAEAGPSSTLSPSNRTGSLIDGLWRNQRRTSARRLNERRHRVSGSVPSPVIYRRARVEDAERTFEVVKLAADDLLLRNGRQPTAGAGLPPERVIRFRHACVAHDPERFWVAEADGATVGAGFAVLRDAAWYLGGLHVLPGWQGQGIGTELLRRTLTGTGPGTTLSVLTDALNQDSNGLYLRFGMLPQDSTLTFDGPLAADVA